MIRVFSLWIKNLSVSLVIVSILEMIIPNNKTKKYIRVVMGLYVLCSIVSPFIENSISVSSFELANYIDSSCENICNEKIDQKSMDVRLAEIYKKELKKDIESKLENMGYKVNLCKVDAHISDENSGIDKILLKVDKKKIEKLSESNLCNIEEIDEIKINSSIDEEISNKNQNVNKDDLELIKSFIIKEYGVSEECLKIN